ncbi:MAG: hypothetical protein HRT74_04365 [Flavobacteriales bacterium]|nr:hypothetical protein [Flavobacteriales bacterium]
MRWILVFAILTSSFLGFGQLDLARDQYFQVPSKKVYQNLIAIANNIEEESLKKGYEGAATACLAEYGINPFAKLNLFKDGTAQLEGAIKTDPTNPELRFLRLTIQLESPSFLDYQSEIEQDTALIQSALASGWMKDATFGDQIKQYLTKKGL